MTRTDDYLLTPSEVGAVFGVNSKTITRWAAAGKIPAIKTLGGHRRYRASDVRRLVSTPEWANVVLDITENAQADVIDIRDPLPHSGQARRE